jgi:signal transduction histidine kinase
LSREDKEMRETTLIEEFLLVPEFADLPPEELEWLAGQATDFRFHAGDVLIREGAPADVFVVLLEGEIRYRRDSMGASAPVFISRAPEIGGILPLSRMKTFTVNGVALAEGRAALMNKSIFPEMLLRMPELNRRLAGVMSDRVREVAEIEQQHEKLMALGKLAGGLAHEINNPAAAARSAAQGVGVALQAVRRSTLNLGQLGYPDFAWQLLFDYEEAALKRCRVPAVSNGLDHVDREERVTSWMEQHGVKDAWTIAAALADWDVDVHELDELAARCPPRFLPEVLIHICSVLTSERLLGDVQNGLARISGLVGAVKDYSFMDQEPVQELDLHDGLENTLTMLGYRMEHVEVVKDFDRSLPRLCAHGSALNQVWTNLIENALDAMPTGGTLRLRTARELDCALVEIGDTGSGIPEEIQGRIFEPFFTTKAVGRGTGLGLDLVRKLLWNHNGSVGLSESKPGNTRFQVRLPFNNNGLS